MRKREKEKSLSSGIRLYSVNEWMNECDCQWFIDFNRNFIYFSFCLFFNEHYSIQKLFLDSYWFFLFLFFCCCCCFRSFWVFVCYNYYNSDCCWNENDNGKKEKVKFVHKIVMFVWYFKPKSVCLFVFFIPMNCYW